MQTKDNKPEVKVSVFAFDTIQDRDSWKRGVLMGTASSYKELCNLVAGIRRRVAFGYQAEDGKHLASIEQVAFLYGEPQFPAYYRKDEREN